ncbi:MAG: bifunctional UDP-sugar hydrolase/5'-nucleotidase [Actinomyces urogenitalis]|uniref:bifunctional metallophosphatase/5'-nucleotidase n=1 Tax=Actinomyces urogenitalis TaxID=103621 RepID=UPI002A7FB4D2|nr:bifunctional UDP-sugar hydrolase/5'-nucleotidase [Actinomyces urogenitalis]MDY3677840.1 bifunctional UDP-sugar hydrolase/5'-nucleotidase [Actinomyces urogenitalis]
MRLLSRTTTSLAIAALAAGALAPAASAADEQPVTGSPETGAWAAVDQLGTSSSASTAEPASAVAGSPATSSEEVQPAAVRAAEAQPAADQGAERAAAPTSDTTITILGITDFHGHLLKDTESLKDGTTKEVTGGATGLACAVKTAREAKANTLFVSAGDNVGGSAYISSILQDQPTIDALNAIGLDATATGNHEFDRGITDLADRILPALNAPVLSANVTGNAALSAEGEGNGTFVKEVDGVRVGFVGVVTDELPSLVSAQALEDLTVADATQTANERAAALKDGNESNGEADVVVVLAHEDAAIYGHQFNGAVDAVVAGHTHVPFAKVVDSTQGTKIAVVQPDHYGNVLGNITLTVSKDAAGKASVTHRSAENMSLVGLTGCEDAYGVGAIVEKAKTDSDEAGKKVVASLGSDFLRGTQMTGGKVDSTGSNRGTESTASNLIADSFAWWVRNNTTASGDHFVGIMNPGGVRADYAQGELTYGEAYTVQPFGNELGYGAYTGAQLRQILAEQWQPAGASRSVLTLGVSGNVSVFVNQDVADAVQADSAADRTGLIKAVYIDGAPLADDAKVVVASNSFLLAGGDNFAGFKAAPFTNTGIIDLDATSEYLQDAGNLTASYAKRQIGVSVTQNQGQATIRLTGLSFSNAVEQQADGAAKSVSVVLTLPDGTSKVLAQADIDRTLVASGLPSTGTAVLRFAVPQGLPTDSAVIAGVSDRAAALPGALALVVTNNDGTTRQLELAPQLEVPQAAPNNSTEEIDGTPVAKTPKSKLANTGASVGIGALAVIGLLGAGGVLVARRRGEDAGESTGENAGEGDSQE